MKEMPDKLWFRPDEVAKLLSFHRNTIYRWIDEGKLEVSVIGPHNAYRIHRTVVKSLIHPLSN